MRASFVLLLLVACATPPPPPPPPPPFDGFPFQHAVTLAEVGCTEVYSADAAASLELEKRYKRPGDDRYTFNKYERCDRAPAWAMCELKLRNSAMISYLYKKANARQTGYHCRQTGGTFTEFR